LIDAVEGRSPQEIIAELLVDHFIHFRGCDHHEPIDRDEYGITAFITERQEMEVPSPDFAEDERLPREARAGDWEGPDMGRRMMKDRLSSTTSSEEWIDLADELRRSFTGKDEGGEIKHFRMASGDLVHHHREQVRKMARGRLTVDIDSVLSLFTDLSKINCTIDIAMVWNPWRNLESSVHIAHRGIPLHRIPHFFLGRFGRDLNFDLYMFVPKAYDKNAKVRGGVIPNRVREETIAAFMDECFLKAVFECIPDAQSNRWPSRYEIQKAKAMAAGIEGRLYRKSRSVRHMELSVPLVAKFIPAVWKRCQDHLKREIDRSNAKLTVLEGFQLFINSKGTKDRLFMNSIPEVMSMYKDKVSELEGV
jgi:hypothetical protein